METVEYGMPKEKTDNRSDRQAIPTMSAEICSELVNAKREVELSMMAANVGTKSGHRTKH